MDPFAKVYNPQVFQIGGGTGSTFGQNGEENLYMANFLFLFWQKIIFFAIFEKLQLKNAIKSNYQGGLG